MASLTYNRWRYNLMCKIVDMVNDTIKVQLHTVSYTPAATHNVKADLSAEVANGGGYATGGATLGSKAVTQAAAAKFAGDATTSWASATFTARYAVLVDDTLANDDLIACIDFGADYTATNGTFTITWNAAGIITLS